jgi:F420-non-reducing hydrogenase small subunit
MSATPATQAKPKVGFYWCASCGGCEESVVDLAEGLLDVADAVDIVFWPVALDFKKSDVEALADGEITATFVNGAIRTSEQAEMARLLRRKSQILIAYGACSHLGGIPGLANLYDRESILREIYDDGPSTVNPTGKRPQTLLVEDGREVELPEFHETVRALNQVVEVDYYVPGCAPTPKMTKTAVDALLTGTLPPRGSVIAPDTALCDECPRIDTKPADLAISKFHRPHEIVIDEDVCLLAQGIPCLGPATRAGCEAACILGNMPCSGCCGPTGRVMDQGGKLIAALGSIMDARTDEDAEATMDSLPDPLGTFYRYSLPTSMLRRRRLTPTR